MSIGHVAYRFSLPKIDHNLLWRVAIENIRAVYIFIILSGFFICFMLNARRESYGAYLFRRAMRLYPAYLVCLLAASLTMSIAMTAYNSLLPGAHGRNLDAIVMIESSEAYFPLHFAAHIVMMHGLLPDWLLPYSEYAILGVAWSLSVEWQFYLIAPFVFKALSQRPSLGAWGPLAVMLAILVLLRPSLGYGFIGNQMQYFAIGIASFFVWRNLLDASETYRWRRAIARCPELLIVGLPCVLFVAWRSQWEVAIWLGFFLVCITHRLDPERTLPRMVSNLLCHSWFRHLGQISYSLYLCHMVVLPIVIVVSQRCGLSGYPLVVATFGATTALSLLMADVLYRVVEAPCIRWGSRQLRGSLVSAR